MSDDTIEFPALPGLGAHTKDNRVHGWTCSDCIFFSVDLQNIKQGWCHANPPQMLVNQREGSVMVMRPKTGADNIACRFLSLAKN
jgi:hypothetical protein